MYSSLPRFRKYIYFTGCSAIIIALLVLTGWQFSIQVLKTLLPGITPMNPVTAITFILCGAWLILFVRLNHSFRDIIAVIITLVGLIHFVTYFFPAPGLRMDYWLYGDVIRDSGIPNLIAPNTALNFLLCGISMLLTGRGNKKVQVTRQALVFTCFILSYTSLLGYVFHIQPAYRFGGLTPMALITTFGFFFVVLGLILSDMRVGLTRIFTSSLNGGRLMRRIVPFILILPPLINYLALIGAKKGWYSQEFGTQLATFIFTLFLLLFICFYAGVINKQQRRGQDQDQRFASLMESINEGIVEADSNGIIVYVNGAFEKMMGYKASEIVGLSAVEVIIPGKDRASFEARLERRRKGIEESYVNELVDKEGRKKQMSIYAKPLYDSKGNFKSILVSFRDITEELRQLQDIKAFTDFAAHDLKAPLVNISMLVEVAKEMQFNEDQMNVINMIDESALKMRKLVDELLQFSRLGAGELTREKVDTAAIVKDILRNIDTSRHSMHIDPLPVVEANEIATVQLFTNLISNAVKYSSRAPSPIVKIGSYKKNERTFFYVSDNGIGMDPKYFPELFQPFRRFTSQFKGNGLGLAIVKRIIERHGGQIDPALNEGGGMRFDFTLTPEKRML